MLVKRPFWQSLLIGIITGLCFTVILSLIELYLFIDKTFSLTQAIFYFICFSLFHTLSNRWKIKKTNDVQ